MISETPLVVLVCPVFCASVGAVIEVDVRAALLLLEEPDVSVEDSESGVA